MSQTIKNTFKSYCFFTSHWCLLTLLLEVEALPLLLLLLGHSWRSSCWGVPPSCVGGKPAFVDPLHILRKKLAFSSEASKRRTAGEQEPDFNLNFVAARGLLLVMVSHLKPLLWCARDVIDNEFVTLMTLLEISVSGCTCFKTLYLPHVFSCHRPGSWLLISSPLW